jgi:hypothetical protein
MYKKKLSKEKKLKGKWQFVINNMVAIKESKKIKKRRYFNLLMESWKSVNDSLIATRSK